jgi:hypothetical protein
MLREMIKDSVAVTAYMLLLAFSSGIAFSVGIPSPAAAYQLYNPLNDSLVVEWPWPPAPPGGWTPAPPPPRGPPEYHSYHPLFAGLWASLGEMDASLLGHVYDIASDARNRFNWLPILMWLEAFLTTVFLVNLMSAPHSCECGPCGAHVPTRLQLTSVRSDLARSCLRVVAKMTSTYERIRSESLHYRAHQRCEFIIEVRRVANC